MSPQEAPVKCPRCDSPNTKFCYYNNYSLTQPRHFCKTCRRYWTKGGALRNVPIGGGSRRNKKTKPPPAMDFQLAAINNTPRFSNADHVFNHFSSSAFESSPLTGFSFPLSSSLKAQADRNGPLGFQEMGYSNFALSSINQDLHWKLQQQRLASLFVEKPQPILFQNLEKDGGNGKELFFNNSATAAGNNWSGINQPWTELTHFTSLP